MVFLISTSINFLLALYSTKIGKLIKKQTGNKPNSKLIYVHITNLLGFSIAVLFEVLILSEIEALENKAGSCQDNLNLARFQTRSDIFQCFVQAFWTYVDLFLLWLLMRFSRTNRHEDKDEIPFLESYAHQGESATSDITEQVVKRNEERKQEIIAEQNQLFL